jgi:hypothetical protein
MGSSDAPRCAERHPHTDFLFAGRNGIAQDSVDSKHGKQEGGDSESQ